MGYTQWVLVQEPDHTFQFVTTRSYADFHSGIGTLSQARPGEVRTVEVSLFLERRIVRDVLRVNYRRTPVLHHTGRRDPLQMQWELTLLIAIIGSPLGTRPDRVRGERARRQLTRAINWVPTADERSVMADAISRRAKRPLLGRRPPLQIHESLGYA